MNCEKALELIGAELDGTLTEKEETALRAHLDCCPDCRETRRRLHETDDLLQDSELDPPAALHDGVMHTIRNEQMRPKKRAWIPAAAVAAAAALVLLAGKAGLIALPGFEQESSVTVNVGSAAEQIFQWTQSGTTEPDAAAAQQAAELAAETGLDVLLLWNGSIPSELDLVSYKLTQTGARLYRVSGALAQTLLDANQAAVYAVDNDFSDLSEKTVVCVLLFV